jgi:ABC-2 type transport system ATP-binding protein
MIKVKALVKKFGGLCAVNGLDLDIRQGEFYCLLGPNGAGKTTTLKIISGLMQPTQGKIILSGFDMSRDPLRAKQVLGFIPDTPFLYDNLTPREFLDFTADIFALDKEKYLKTADHYFSLFGIENYRDVLIKELSHGTRQKIVYISNFIHEPSVYLIDEPLVGLDPQSIHLLKNILKEEAGKGRTILMCTHILSLAEELCDRVGILHEGRLIAEGSVHELRVKLSQETLEKVFLKLTCEKQ